MSGTIGYHCGIGDTDKPPSRFDDERVTRLVEDSFNPSEGNGILNYIDHLKVCGTCRHCSDAPYLDGSPECDQYEWGGQVARLAPCFFTPSRYKPYWESE